jgi:hypothetical protein
VTSPYTPSSSRCLPFHRYFALRAMPHDTPHTPYAHTAHDTHDTQHDTHGTRSKPFTKHGLARHEEDVVVLSLVVSLVILDVFADEADELDSAQCGPSISPPLMHDTTHDTHDTHDTRGTHDTHDTHDTRAYRGRMR